MRTLALHAVLLAAIVRARDAAIDDDFAQDVDGAMPEKLYISSRRRMPYGGGSYGGGSYGGGSYGGYHPGYSGSHTEYHHGTATDEVKKAFWNGIFGFVLFVLGFPVLWFNEGREAHMWVLFGKARSMMITVSDKSVDRNNEASLVNVQSQTGTDETLKSKDFPVSVQNCTKLSTDVQMYQWQENQQTEERDNGQGGKDTFTTYTYEQVWSSFPIDSNSFNDRSYSNPPMPYQSSTKQANFVSLGAFNLSKRLIGMTNNFVNCGDNEIGNMRGFGPMQGGLTTVPPGQPPQIGSLRVTFQKVPCGDTSVLAVQHGESFAPLTYDMQVSGGKVIAPNGNLAPLLEAADNDIEFQGKMPDGVCSCIGTGCSCIKTCIMSRQEVYELAESRMSGGQLLDRAVSSQQCIHKVLKLVGFVMLFAGLDFMGQFLPTIFRYIPFLGTWIQWAMNGVVHFVSFCMAGFFYFVTVALAWLRYRPVKAALLLLVAIGCVVAVYAIKTKLQGDEYQ